jgi:hypothetical protein
MEGTTDRAPQTTVIQIRIFRSGYAHPGGWMAFTAFAVGLRRPCTARVIYKGMSCITEQDASGTADHQGGVTLCATSTGMGLCRRTPRECLLQSEGPGPQTAPVAAIDRPQQKVRRFRSQTRVKMQDDGRRAVGRGARWVREKVRLSQGWPPSACGETGPRIPLLESRYEQNERCPRRCHRDLATVFAECAR